MTNPLEEFLEEYVPTQEKTAISMADVSQHAGDFAGSVGRGAALGAGSMIAGAAVAGVGMAAEKIYSAATKSRDFKRMLENNPDLQEHHERDPRMFNQMFTSLRSMNPNFSADPIVAGTYMRRMVENPLTAGGILTESLSTRDKFRSPLGGVVEQGVGAARSQFTDSMGRGSDNGRSEVLPGRNPVNRAMSDVQTELFRRQARQQTKNQPTGRHGHVGVESKEDMRGRGFSMDDAGRPFVQNVDPEVYKARR